MIPLRLLLLLLTLASLPASAGLFDTPRPSAQLGGSPDSPQFLPVDQAFQPSLTQDDANPLVVHFRNAPGYYLYRHRFAFASDPEGLALAPAEFPEGKHKVDEYFGEVEVYYGDLDIRIPLERAPDRPYTLLVTYQGCADQGLCYPPETHRFELAATASDSASPPDTEGPAWRWGDLALFFLAGLGLTFTPCVLPMLPILSGVVLRGQLGGSRALGLSLAYVVPMATSFALLGALMGLFGAGLNLQARLQSPWVLVPFAAFFAVFALAMFSVFELRLPGILRYRLDRLASRAQGGSYLGAAVLGVLSSLLVSPCVSAPLAGALLYISSSGDAWGGGLQLFALGLGMGTPLVLFACGGGALLPRSGAWMLGVRNAFGVLLLAVAVWLLERVLPGPVSLALWGTLAVGSAIFLGALEFTAKSSRMKLAQLAGLALLAYGLTAWFGALQGRDDPLRPLGRERVDGLQIAAPTEQDEWATITTPEQLQQWQEQASAAGEPLLLDWYADWCISCKVIEREVLPAPAVREQLARFRRVRFDITDSTAAQRALLDRYGLFGPPAMQLFAASGNEVRSARVVGEIDAKTLAERLARAVPAR